MAEIDQALADLAEQKRRLDATYEKVQPSPAKPTIAAPVKLQGPKKRNLEAEYAQLQQEFEAASAKANAGGMPAGSAPTPPGIFSNFMKEVPAGAVQGAMVAPDMAAKGIDVINAGVDKVLNPAYKKLGLKTNNQNLPNLSDLTGQPVDIARRLLGLQPAPQGVSGWAGNIAGNMLPAGVLSGARRMMRPAAEATAPAVNPLLEKALKLAQQKALPPARSMTAQRVPSWRTASGMEGPEKWVRPEDLSAKPKIKMPTEQAKTGLSPKAAGKQAREKAASAPKEAFNTFLGDRLSNVAPDIAKDLKTVYETKGEDAALDLAIDLAAKGKLTLK